MRRNTEITSLSIQQSRVTREGHRALALAACESPTLTSLFIDAVDDVTFNLFVQACHTRTLALRLGWHRKPQERQLPSCVEVTFGTNATQNQRYQKVAKAAESMALNFSHALPLLPSLQRMLFLPELSDVYHKIAYLCEKQKQPAWALAWFLLAKDTTGEQLAAQRFVDVNRIKEKHAHAKLRDNCQDECFDRALGMLQALKNAT